MSLSFIETDEGLPVGKLPKGDWDGDPQVRIKSLKNRCS
jgi:hypothetical protein